VIEMGRQIGFIETDRLPSSIGSFYPRKILMLEAAA